MGNPMALDGIWKYNYDTQVLDDKCAKALGHVQGDHPAPHGTYTRIQYFLVRTTSRDGKPDVVLDIFNEEGEFARFVWDGSDSWVADTNPGVSYSNPVVENGSFKVLPSLLLSKYEPANLPSNATSENALYIASCRDDSLLKGQKITPHEMESTFTWTRPGADFRQGLTFTRCYQQGTGEGEGDKTFGDTFKHAPRMAQLAFPFYGFDPSRMHLSATSPLELTANGPGTGGNHTIDTNPHQSFNGALVFAFPTEDSRDYVRIEDLVDQPFLPLGLGGAPLDSREEHAHTEMISSVKDQMKSWSVTLGLSAGLPELLTTEGESAVNLKLEEQAKTERRYAVTRKVSKKWVIFADIPQHRLHESFHDAILSRTVDLLQKRDPRWGDFLTTYGTHYAHAITQGSIEYAETRFSLQAETKAIATKLDLTAQMNALIEGFQIGEKFKYSEEFSKRTHIEISDEDVTSYSFGTDFPMGIFFDLRPLPELLSPIFFPYNPEDKDGKYAPFIWHQTRKSLREFLTQRAANRPVEIDYTPYLYKVTFPHIKVTTSEKNCSWYGAMVLDGSNTALDTGKEFRTTDNQPWSVNQNYGPAADKLNFNCRVVGRPLGRTPPEVDVSCHLHFKKNGVITPGQYILSFRLSHEERPSDGDSNSLGGWRVMSDFPWPGAKFEMYARADRVFKY